MATLQEKEAELAALQCTFDEFLASSRELEEELDAELEKMRKELSSAERKNATLTSQISAMTPQMTSLENKIASLTSQLSAQTKLRVTAEQQSEEAEAKLRQVEFTLKNIHSQHISALKKCEEEYDKYKSQCQEDCEDAYEKMALMEEELEDMRRQLEEEREHAKVEREELRGEGERWRSLWKEAQDKLQMMESTEKMEKDQQKLVYEKENEQTRNNHDHAITSVAIETEESSLAATTENRSGIDEHSIISSSVLVTNGSSTGSAAESMKNEFNGANITPTLGGDDQTGDTAQIDIDSIEVERNHDKAEVTIKNRSGTNDEIRSYIEDAPSVGSSNHDIFENTSNGSSISLYAQQPSNPSQTPFDEIAQLKARLMDTETELSETKIELDLLHRRVTERENVIPYYTIPNIDTIGTIDTADSTAYAKSVTSNALPSPQSSTQHSPTPTPSPIEHAKVYRLGIAAPDDIPQSRPTGASDRKRPNECPGSPGKPKRKLKRLNPPKIIKGISKRWLPRREKNDRRSTALSQGPVERGM